MKHLWCVCGILYDYRTWTNINSDRNIIYVLTIRKNSNAKLGDYKLQARHRTSNSVNYKEKMCV